MIRRITGPGAGGQIWRRAWFASALVMVACVIVHVHSTRMVPKSSDDVLALAFEQRVLTQRIVRGGLQLDAAVGGEDYDAIEPTLVSLRAGTHAWAANHERLCALAEMGVQEPISRMVNPHAQLERGLDELLLVGASAERRAPYLDRETADRIARASALVVRSEAGYSGGLELITRHRREMIDARIDAFRASSRGGLLFVVLLVLAAPPIVVFPALGFLRLHAGVSSSDASGGVVGRIENEPASEAQQPDAGRRAA